jgi:hypothetical protein
MFIDIKKVKVEYTRPSKLHKVHTYTRTKSIALLKCDCCSTVFERAISNMSSARLNNEYNHVCPNCDNKKFAQKKGVERRKLWDSPIDSEIGRL